MTEVIAAFQYRDYVIIVCRNDDIYRMQVIETPFDKSEFKIEKLASIKI